MKNLLLLFTVFISALTQAQITITGADLPSAGKAFVMGNDTAPSVSLGTPGSSQQTWDFTTLTNNYPKAAVYDSTSLTPFAGQFPASNIYTYGPAEFFGVLYGGAPVYANQNGYCFWKSDTTGLWVEGFEAVSGPYANMPVHENAAELLIGAPVTYGTTFTDTSRWALVLGGPYTVDTTWVTGRTKSLTCDAWGQLNTPFGNFSNVIRIHENVTETDSIIATYNGIVEYQMLFSRQTTNNYMYLANGIGYPLAIVQADSNNNIKNIEYLLDTSCFAYSKIMGSIANDSGNLISSGVVYLYQFIDSLTPMLLVDSTVINSNGFYVFINVSVGNYIISAQANLTVCPTCITTYSGNANFWYNGNTIVDALCTDTMLTNIILAQLAPMTGHGALSGFIQFGLGARAVEPVAGAGVLLQQVSGGTVAHTTSDAGGNYSFANVPPGNYTITVDYPGLPMVSTYTVGVTSNNLVFNNLNFTVDTVHGNGGIFGANPLAVHDVEQTNPQVTVYPNPSAGQFNLAVETTTPCEMGIKVYSAIGQLVYQEPATGISGNTNKIIHLEQLAAGIYTLQTKLGDEMINRKLVVRK
jgi:hypothetical protein